MDAETIIRRFPKEKAGREKARQVYILGLVELMYMLFVCVCVGSGRTYYRQTRSKYGMLLLIQ